MLADSITKGWDYCSVLPPVSYHQRGIHDEGLHCVLHRRSCWWIEMNWRWVSVHDDGRWKSGNGASNFVGLYKKGNPLPRQLVRIIIVFTPSFRRTRWSWSLQTLAKKQLEDLAGLWFNIVGSIFEKTIKPLFLSIPLVNISSNLKRRRMKPVPHFCTIRHETVGKSNWFWHERICQTNDVVYYVATTIVRLPWVRRTRERPGLPDRACATYPRTAIGLFWHHKIKSETLLLRAQIIFRCFGIAFI
jgi:hypothetical protein